MLVHSWDAERPSRVAVASIYAKRLLLRNLNSRPFISVDAFVDQADYVHSPTRFRYNRSWFRSLKQAKVIFCPSNELVDFFQEFGGDISARVVISGNSDHEFHSWPEYIPGSVRHLFLQNSFISDASRITTLPIGVENIRYGVNGLPWMLKAKSISFRNPKILLGPFGLTHNERLEAFENLSQIPHLVDVLQNRISPSKFSEVMRAYSYVAVVRGNGVDTHRLWESLYRGCTPILKLDAWSKSLSDLNLPIKYVDNWDAEEVSRIANEAAIRFNPKTLQSLWWPYWKKRIIGYL